MAFNKSKALESALKSLNQGRVPDAIREYQQILRQDAKDQVTLMTLGDLFVRQGDMHSATQYFERLAQVYLSDGFNSKAIAIYKKIAKLAPQELDPLERLADLYVQQGVLSEARPLYLQIAEGHLKGNRAPRAVEVLRRLLEVEPENLRVQMRLAELYNVIGQKGEAAKTYLNYAQRLMERGELAEVEKLCDRALEVDPSNAAAVAMKAHAFGMSGNTGKAVELLKAQPDAEAGGETTSQIINQLLRAEDYTQAMELARRVFERGNQFYPFPLHVATALLQAAQPADALGLLKEIREAVIEAGEQDKLLEALSSVANGLPGEIEPLEALVGFCRETNNPFRLSDAVSQLAQAYSDAGKFDRAEALLQELLEKKPDDEKLAARLEAARAKVSGGAAAAGPAGTVAASPSVLSPVQAFPEAPRRDFDAPAEEEKAAQQAKVHVEPALDEETQKYIAQALTDVDLFSSYGLTQKATHLLESVLQKAPRHTPALERLLDITLGAGDELRTARLAAELEQIHLARGDQKNAERFAELRQRYQGAAAHSAATQAAKPAVAPVVALAPPAAAPVHPAPAPLAAAPELEIAEFDLSITEPEAEVAVVAQADAPASVEEEVDLSEEWESLSQEAIEAAAKAVAGAPAAPAEAQAAPVAETAEDEAFFEIEEPAPGEIPGIVAADAPLEVHAAAPQVHETPAVAEAVPVKAADETVLFGEEAPAAPVEATQLAGVESQPQIAAADEAVVASEPTVAEPVAETADEFEFDLVPAGSELDEPVAAAPKSPMTSDQFLSDLTAELGADPEPVPASAAPRSPAPAPASAPGNSHGVSAPPLYQVPPHVPAAAPISALGSSVPMEAAAQASQQPATGAIATATLESGANLNELEEVFQEFRTELGEMNDEDEDLETHYNLGIAYREMGLLDEAIGEFQKVAKAIQHGKPFRYAMQCATLLGLTFIDKGEPQIAALWYSRALETPGIDQETVLALRYDLGLAQEQAGESRAALTSFRQVYAVNIDYRDVAGRIATLQKR
jgi:tetratricopeptide (TPR) repeat protein